jgi:4'-phosphopantetheinyl transferase
MRSHVSDSPSSHGIGGIGCPAVKPCSAPTRILPDDEALLSEAHVVCIRLDRWGDGSKLIGLLDDRERARAARFVNPRDGRRYIVSHAVTRTVLGRFVGVPPAALHFRTASAGKPHLAQASLDFNLSHSGERALLAITRGGPIGVDIEEIHPLDVEGLTHRFFSGAEHEALIATDSDNRVAAFFRCWTRKESFIKAIGDGLAFPLSGFVVAFGEHVGNALLRCDVASVRADDWRVVPLDAAHGYAAAVTVSNRVSRVWQWDVPDET